MAFEKSAKRNVNVNYGPRSVSEQYGARGVQDLVKRAVWKFTYNTLPAAGTTNQEQVIPANSVIVGARLIPTVTWAGGTSLTVGLAQKDGTTIAATGIYAATNLTVANNKLDKGTIQAADGTLINKLSSATYDGEVVVAATGTMSAGAAILIVDYITLA